MHHQSGRPRRRIDTAAPPPSALAAARDVFHSLLENDTSEADWQRFFAEHPFVLSMSLPIKLSPFDIVPRARPGKAEPDFIFFPHDDGGFPHYGVIELKKPTTKIFSRVRSNVVILSRDAETAVSQAQLYSDQIFDASQELLDAAPIFIGNALHIFVILGMSHELSHSVGGQMRADLAAGRLPPSLQLIPYDTLLHAFERQVGPQLHVLVPEIIGLEDASEQESTRSAHERVGAFFARLPRHAAAASGVTATYVFEIIGAGIWTVAVREGVIDVAEADSHADLRVTTSAEDWMHIASGDTSPTSAYMTGKLKLTGDMGAAMKLQKLL